MLLSDPALFSSNQTWRTSSMSGPDRADASSTEKPPPAPKPPEQPTPITPTEPPLPPPIGDPKPEPITDELSLAD